MCSGCSTVATSCRAQIAERNSALNITVDKDGDSAISAEEISDGAVPSPASRFAVTPRRRSRSARPYFLATPAPGSMFSGPALARSFQLAVSSPPRCTLPCNGVIHDPYRGDIEVHDVSCIPGSRGVRLISLPRTRSVITGTSVPDGYVDSGLDDGSKVVQDRHVLDPQFAIRMIQTTSLAGVSSCIPCNHDTPHPPDVNFRGEGSTRISASRRWGKARFESLRTTAGSLRFTPLLSGPFDMALRVIIGFVTKAYSAVRSFLQWAVRHFAQSRRSLVQ